MKCPFFNEECLGKDCVAFEEKPYYGREDYEGHMVDVIGIRPYCNVLKVFIPFRR